MKFQCEQQVKPKGKNFLETACVSNLRHISVKHLPAEINPRENSFLIPNPRLICLSLTLSQFVIGKLSNIR